FGFYLDACNGDAFDPGFVAFGEECGGSCRHAQEFDRKRWDNTAFGVEEGRNAANDAVRIRLDRDQAPSGSCPFENWQVRHEARNPKKVAIEIVSDCGNWCNRQFGRISRGGNV